jgi:hypothetical protein
MSDETNLPSRNDWKAGVRSGDIILFAFPIQRAAPGETPKARPCVVLDVVTVCGERHLLLAYGTSVNTPANRGQEIAVTDAEHIRDAGIDKPTRFVGARRMVVPLDHAGFVTSRQRNPVIGQLTGEARERLDVVRAHIAATAAHAAQRRAALPGRGATARVVIVERRRLDRSRPGGGRGHSRPAGNPADRRSREPAP